MFMKGFERLKTLKPWFSTSLDLTPETKQKVKDTSEYSLSQDPTQEVKTVVQRNIIAMLAEQKIAQFMDGMINSGDEDTDYPITFAYDVLCPIKYNGMRIEVKTTMSDKWISVSTGDKGPYAGHTGINLGPFIEHKVADVMIIIKVKEVHGHYKFEPFMLCQQGAFNKETVKKSNFEGWYLDLKSSNPNVYYYQKV